MGLDKPAIGASRNIDFATDLFGILSGFKSGAEDYHIDRDFAPLPDKRILALHQEVSFFATLKSRWHDFGGFTSYDINTLVKNPQVEFLVPLPEAADIYVKLVDLGIGFLFHQMRELECIHAANTAAIFVVIL